MTGKNRRIAQAALLLLGVLISHISGLFMGYFLLGGSQKGAEINKLPAESTGKRQMSWNHLRRVAMEMTSAENIRRHLKKLTLEPHVAGTPAQSRTAQYVAQHWRSAEWKVFTKNYTVLLTYPGKPQESGFDVLDGSHYSSQTVEKVLTDEGHHPDVEPPYLAYSPSGTVQGRAVYANFGLQADFQFLRQQNIQLNGTIAVVRSGLLGRGDKLRNAAEAGCIGLLLYPDPDVWAPPELLKKGVGGGFYPRGWWLPPSGVQRGSTMLGYGDPATQDYPAVKSAYRSTPDQIARQGVLPPIPGHPISYADAEYLLSRMGTKTAPRAWQGGLGFNYCLGPGPLLRLRVLQRRQQRQITNVYATFTGYLEPDRYVLVGNHRDAWVFGAVDPGSGTAVLLETARVLGELRRRYGWRPRRTVVLCSWDAEEFGLVGSTEWVEDELHRLKHGAVAYINVDIAVRGNYVLDASASPLLRKVLADVMDSVPSPSSRQSLWKDLRRSRDSKYNYSNMQTPLGGSDHAAFVQIAGIPSIDLTYMQNPKMDTFYALYHTSYETFHYMDRTVDPGFKCHRAVSRVITELVHRLADPDLLPLDPRELGRDIQKRVHDLLAVNQVTFSGHTDVAHAVEYLTQAAEKLKQTADVFANSLLHQNTKQHCSITIRSINDRLQHLNQALLEVEPGHHRLRHVLHGGARHPQDCLPAELTNKDHSQQARASRAFPQLGDILCALRNSHNRTENLRQLDKILRTIVYHIDSVRKMMTTKLEE